MGFLGLSSVSAQELFDVKSSNEQFSRGVNLYYQDNYQESLTAFEEAVRINPDNAEAFYFIGYAYYKEGKFSKASDAFKTAYDLNHEYSPIPLEDLSRALK